MKKINNFFSTSMEFDDSLSYRRRLLIRYVLFLAILIFIFFTFFNLFYTHNYTIAFFDILAAIFSIYAIVLLKKTNNIEKASQLATVNFMIFFILFIYSGGNEHFGLIWTIFLPIFAIQVNGRKLGLIFSFIFYSIFFTMAYNGIGSWNDGLWAFQDFLRLSFSSLLLIYILFMNEKTLESSHKKFMEVREKEKDYMEQLHQLSIIDPLTSLYNRRYFNDMSEKLVALSNRQGLIFTFFILDIDYFKNFNDNYGHQEGDEVLQKISKVLKDYIQRDDDFVFRLGGEEFAGIIISKDEKDYHNIVAPISSIIEDLKIEHSHSEVSKYLTVSIGAICLSPNSDYNIKQIYAMADKALYKAKNNGRNQVEFIYKCT